MNFEILIITCDKTQWILPLTFYFLNKYLPKNFTNKITILGFNKPNIEFSNNYNFKSLGENQNINNWSNDIYNYTKTIDNEYIMFLLDDFFLLDHLRIDKLKQIIQLMDNDKEIGLCNIGYAPQCIISNEITKNKDNILINDEDFFLFEQNSLYYQINCQPSIYRLSHFNRYFQVPNSPWKLELSSAHHSIKKKLISCSPLKKSNNKQVNFPEKNQQPIYKTQLRSALSAKQFPGKINMNYAKQEDIDELIKMGLIKPEQIL